MTARSRRPPLFPYTTLFRSVHRAVTGSNAHTRWWADGAVGVIVLDNPPMNVLSDDNRRGIREALAEFRGAGTRAVVLTGAGDRSEEHMSELQSHSDLVCRLL